MSTFVESHPGRLRVNAREITAEQAGEVALNGADDTFTTWMGPLIRLRGYGEELRFEAGGSQAMELASDWWQSICDEARVSGVKIPQVELPITIGSFGFNAQTPGTLIVPSELVVESEGKTYLVSSLWEGPEHPNKPGSASEKGEEASANGSGKTNARSASPNNKIVEIKEGALSASQWEGAVEAAARIIAEGGAQKIVLARDVVVSMQREVSASHLARRLRRDYPSCWIYAVDGLVGATPEMLAQVRDGQLLCRVLAGTAEPGQDQALWESAKDQLEHAVAVQSVRDSLGDLLPGLNFPAEPKLLRLPNVCHLCSDVTGQVGQISALQIAAALHPTAAVCGRPTEVARRHLAELEQMDRGRYAAPVGWMDAAGQGEWGIALRCGQILEDAHQVRVIAGGGIMEASDPARELAETKAKMRPLLHALGNL